MTAPIPRIEPLQVLRGIAAMLIVVNHSLYEVNLISPIDFNYGNNSYFTVGIDIFFVLSGFIMVYISRDSKGLSAAKTFITRRLLRIVPTYWFYTLLLALVALTIPQVLGKAEFDIIGLFKSMFFVPYINTAGDVQPLLANGWTLNYEIYFYVVFAVCMILPAKYSLVALSAFFVGSVLTGFWGIGGLAESFYGNAIILEFLAGALIGYLYLKNIRLPAFFFTIGLVFVSLSIIALFFTNTLQSMGIEYPKAFVGVMSVLLLVLPKQAEFMAMPKLGVLIGDSSYTLYLAHPFAIGAVTQVVMMMNWQANIHPWVIFITIFIISIWGSILAYKIIEKPLLSFTKGLVYKRPT